MSLDRAYLLPNPEEYTPSVAEATGRVAAYGKIARSASTLQSRANPAAREAVSTPIMFVGDYPVMSSDRTIMTWGNQCSQNGDSSF